MSRLLTVLLFIGLSIFSNAQDNSPYSRYGLGDNAPNTNVTNRGMGGIAAAYNDYFTINYANPSSYAFFQAENELNSRKLSSGRAVLNIGIDGQGRTLVDKNAKSRFSSSNLLFSHVMLGMPLRKNWGMALGLRPANSINYKMENRSAPLDPNTHLPIDSARTLFEGSGGLFLASLGTGVKLKAGKSGFLSIGANGGYMFGKKDYSRRRSFYNDSTVYAAGNLQNKTGIGGFYFDAGAQYQFQLNKKLFMGIGAYGNWKQTLNTSRDAIAETYIYDADHGYLKKDSVSEIRNIKGNIAYPASVTVGFIIQKPQMRGSKEAGWLLGVDVTQNNWNQYRFEGMVDTAVKSNWQAKIGAEFMPVRKNNYFSNVSYRFGFFTGPDYVYLRKTSIPTYGISFGLGLPLSNYSGAMARFQASIINLGFEYIKRGNDKNILSENTYRISAGFSLSDLWFIKRRYAD